MMNTDRKDDGHGYKHSELTGEVLRCAFEVHNHLGCGFLEKVYERALIFEHKVIIELKVVEFLTKIHKAQMINYLKATGYEVGLILNFAKPRLEYQRIII